LVYKNEIELEKAFLYLVGDNLSILKFKDNVSFNLEDAIEVNNITFSWVKGKSFVTLVDARNITGEISTEAKEHFSKDAKILELQKAQALVLNSLPNRIIATFYMKFHKPAVPVKIFTDFDKAHEWLKEQL